jgi:hypothetical protein
MNNIGFILANMGTAPGPKYIEDQINNFYTKYNDNKELNLVMFNSFNGSSNHNIPVLHLNQAKYFFGKLFVFDIISLFMASHFPNLNNIYYYTNNTPWTEDMNIGYMFWDKIFNNNKLELITDNNTYHIYKNLWKKPLLATERFDHETIQQAIQKS